MAEALRFKVGTARARPGAWTTGTLTLGHYPDGPITTPVNILCGTRPGPVLWVQSAIHGAECGGALGLLRLFKRIDPKRMKGAIIGVMAANPTAFRVLGRNTPYDGENMNRLKAGSTLAVPQADKVKETAPSEAKQVIQAQSADFNAYRERLAAGVPAVKSTEPARQATGRVQAQVDDKKAPAAASPDRLKLSQGGVTTGAASAMLAIAAAEPRTPLHMRMATAR